MWTASVSTSPPPVRPPCVALRRTPHRSRDHCTGLWICPTCVAASDRDAHLFGDGEAEDDSAEEVSSSVASSGRQFASLLSQLFSQVVKRQKSKGMRQLQGRALARAVVKGLEAGGDLKAIKGGHGEAGWGGQGAVGVGRSGSGGRGEVGGWATGRAGRTGVRGLT